MVEESPINFGSINEYQKRILAVLDYIDAHLEEKLSVKLLAGVACFSPYHFHRIFHSIVGESVSSYVKRLKLARAAQRLLYSPGAAVTQIALECGFSSSSDFARSFRSHYGISPGQFVKERDRRTAYWSVYLDVERPLILTDNYITNDAYERNISIMSMGDLHVAYMRMTGLNSSMKSRHIESAFSRLYRWAKARELINASTLILGITLDSPEVVSMKQCRFDACITVPEGVEAQGDIGVRAVRAGGKYAVYSYDRSEADLGESFFKAMEYVYGCWLPFNGYLPEDRPLIEIYRKSDENAGVVTDFYIPVRPI